MQEPPKCTFTHILVRFRRNHMYENSIPHMEPAESGSTILGGLALDRKGSGVLRPESWSSLAVH